MRRYLFQSGLFLLLMLMLSCSDNSTLREVIFLHQNWSFRNASDSIWLQANVPGTVHTDLMENNIIDDPFFRLNEKDIQWIDKTDWEYKTNFVIEEEFLAKDRIELVFKGLDTYAKIYINDKFVITTDNMFIEWIIDCKEYLKVGENKLRVILESPIKIGLDKRDKLGYILPGAENDQSQLGGLGDKKTCVFSRKAQYNFGWDWGPRLVTSGIWQDVSLVGWDMANITDFQIYQQSLSKKLANLRFEIEIESLISKELSLVTIIDNRIADAKEIKVDKGKNKVEFNLDILYPELWWPNGLGEPRLYDIEIQIKDDFNHISAKSTTIGLRTIEVVQTPDSVGASFYFKVNGHPVFMKGANYIPQDVFLNRPTHKDYAYLISSAKDANFNMLRVWGGGIYEKDFFYDLCDQAGILVWQDFMFACAMYPGNKEFLENVEKEAIQNVKRLRNHPSIALWCGDNEILSAWNRWGWKENVMDNQGQDIVDTVWKAYDDVFHNLLPTVVEKNDPDRLYWSSSPSSGFGKLENGKSGDNHYWGVWWGKEPFSMYEEFIPRFMSEFGFQSFPQFSSVKKYTIEEDWDIYSDVMKSHQRSSIGNVTIEEYMVRDYKRPDDFEMFLYVGQLLQAKRISMRIEAHRRSMPYCMGSLYCQINDCWPVASWSGIDYYGKWKALHYAVKESFKPVIISSVLKDNIVDFYIVSDKLKRINGSLVIQLMDFDGSSIYTEKINVKIDSNSSHIYFSKDFSKYITAINSGSVLLFSKLISEDSTVIDEDIQFFTLPKNLKLKIPEINYKVEVSEKQVNIVLKSDMLAKNVFLELNDSIQFSENYFDIIPDTHKTVSFPNTGGITDLWVKENLKVISLIDSFKDNK